MPGTAIQVIVVVENYILRRFDLSNTDRIHVTQAVIERVRGAGIGCRGRGWRQLQICRADVYLLNQLAAIFVPANIDDRSQQQNTSEHDA